MRKLHLIAGLLGVLAFVLSGQVMRLHKPRSGRWKTASA
jgi:hypothetical protein